MLQVKVPATQMLDSLVKERLEDVKKHILVPGGVAARSADQIDAAAQILRTLQSDPESPVQYCLASSHHSLGFDSAYRTCRLTSWAPADNIGYNEAPAVSDEGPASNSLANYRDADGRTRLTGRASKAAASMATDQQTLGYGIHSIDAAAS